MRCKLACVSILFASGLCGESRKADGMCSLLVINNAIETEGVAIGGVIIEKGCRLLDFSIIKATAFFQKTNNLMFQSTIDLISKDLYKFTIQIVKCKTLNYYRISI